jgi:Family of unknown function (DUF6384)
MSDVAVAQTSAAAPKLDDLMLAMDVVDTLRHDQRLVERELSAASSDDAMIERLREVYKGQGIEVSDRILEEGVKALILRAAWPKPCVEPCTSLGWPCQDRQDPARRLLRGVLHLARL